MRLCHLEFVKDCHLTNPYHVPLYYYVLRTGVHMKRSELVLTNTIKTILSTARSTLQTQIFVRKWIVFFQIHIQSEI